METNKVFCDFCNKGLEPVGSSFLYLNMREKIGYGIVDNAIVVEDVTTEDTKYAEVFKINYCPICGTRLRKQLCFLSKKYHRFT